VHHPDGRAQQRTLKKKHMELLLHVHSRSL